MKKYSLAIALISMAIGGCYNASMYRTAEPLKSGQVAAGAGIGYTGFPHSQTVKSKEAAPEDDKAEIPMVMLPYNDYFVRVGVGAGIDIGLKYSVPTEFALDAKFRFLKIGAFSMAINPGVDYSYWIFLHRVGVDLPLLASIRLGRHVQIYGGARFFYNYWHCSVYDQCDADLKGANSLAYGGFLGISLEIPLDPVTIFITPELHYYRLQFVGLQNALNWIQPGIAVGIRFGGEPKPIRRVQPAPLYQPAPAPQPAPQPAPTPQPTPAPQPNTTVPPPVAPESAN